MADGDSGDGALPPGWAWAKLEDICQVNPHTDTSLISKDADVAFLPMAAVQELSGRLDGTIRRPICDVAKGFTRFASGDVIFAKITPCMENGKIAIVPELPFGVGFGSTEFHVVRPHPDIDASYIFHFLAASRFRQDASRNMTGAVGQRRVPTDYMRSAPIPVPPTTEQTRIVARIDDLFGEIEAGEQELEKAREGLAAYRRSVLKAAVTGELTRDWREKNAPNETGADLLKRILAERRAAWEQAELAKMAAKGQKPKGDGRKARYVEPIPPDTSKLQKLPHGWVWVSIGQLCSVGTGATPVRSVARYYDNGNIPWITSALVNRRIITKSDQFITEAAASETNAKVHPGGSIVIAMYGEGKTRGRSALLTFDAATNQALAVLDVRHIPRRTRDYLLAFFDWNYEGFRAKAAGGVQPNLNLEIVKNTAVPLPPLSEQQELLLYLDEELAAISETQTVIVASLRDIGSLRQSTLTAAFSGKLVRQDPHDEPANVLLERLKTEIQSKPARLHKPVLIKELA